MEKAYGYPKIFLLVVLRLVTYNLRIIFGNRFVYFFVASLIFYLLITGISLFSANVATAADIFSQLMFPGLLFVFFPTTFGIQNDADVRILEIIFGIPNYKYKVYLVRIALILLLLWCYLLFLSWISGLLLFKVPVVEMASRLMVPVVFFGMAGFVFSTITHNGNSTVVILIVLALSLWSLSSILGESKWNVFLNPFAGSDSLSDSVYASLITQNVTVMIVLDLLMFLWGIFNLQKREQFFQG
jgi:hypothetical protein